MVTTPIDLLTREALQDPHPIFTWLRENDPVHWSERHHSWIVTRYDDVAELFFRPEISSDRVRPLIGKAKSATTESDELLKMIGEWMVVTDPPLHSRLRQLVTPAFRPARIAMLEGSGDLGSGRAWTQRISKTCSQERGEVRNPHQIREGVGVKDPCRT